MEHIFSTLVSTFSPHSIVEMHQLIQSGSHRIYTRLVLDDGTHLMGTFNDDLKENEAFFSFTDIFQKKGLNVPKILAISTDRKTYIQTDLGDETLYSYLNKRRDGDHIPEDVYDYFRKALAQLPRFQICGKTGFDFSVCYPSSSFDYQAMQWDLNYFKYYFLKLAYIPFDEQKLENDFQTLISYLLEADSSFFLFRDFQSRNIMIFHDDVYFIDYQGGKKGAAQYDVCSLLYQAKAALPEEKREELLDYYLNELSKYSDIQRHEFKKHYYAFVLIRALQVLGAYGYRGYYEQKPHFLQSIPLAIANIQQLLNNQRITLNLPELFSCLRSIIAIDWVKKLGLSHTIYDGLTVVVGSFSYKKGLPQDASGNGGGFIFDCRALPNPGREARFKHSSGKDQAVIDFLEKYKEIESFKQNVFSIINLTVQNYLSRHFNHLTIHFGCTGGQHRSVYFAQQTAQYLRQHYPEINVELVHREKDHWNQ